MSKAPAFQFYPNDWSRDLEEHPLEIEGAWIRICCKLWYTQDRCSITKTLEQWGRILHVPYTKALAILQYISDEKIGDVTFRNGDITVLSRRMERDEHDRVLNRSRQEKFRTRHSRPRSKVGNNATSNADITAMSHDSSSSSSSSTTPKAPVVTWRDAFVLFWEVYPKKIGKGAAEKAWAKIKPGDQLVSKMLDAIKVQSRSHNWTKDDGQFIPNPATWLNQKRWEDEVDAPPDPLEVIAPTDEALELVYGKDNQ